MELLRSLADLAVRVGRVWLLLIGSGLFVLLDLGERFIKPSLPDEWDNAVDVLGQFGSRSWS